MSTREGKHRKPIHLAAHFPGVNSTTVWTDPQSGSQIEFDSFEHMARTAERGFFDFLFLAEGLRLREHRGQIYDLDVVGRPDTFTVLAALAAVTDRLGLTGTINTTFNEPFEVARQFATLDQLSEGRAGWNIVTSSDAFTGANFRRGSFLDYADRYQRAEEFLSVAREFWDSWASDAVLAELISIPTGWQWSTITARNSMCMELRHCPRGGRDIRFCCRPATPTKAATSAPTTPMRCSPCTVH
jgi:alkanesulfonate monooxygenase SsuD/methylene tetrahydromethanopterin reductase-like flavin-dependent oxidoreductase (luciferase family)